MRDGWLQLVLQNKEKQRSKKGYLQLYLDAKTLTKKDIFKKYTSRVKTMIPVAIAAAVCEFSLCNFTEWQSGSSFLCSYCYSKPKDKQMLHLASFKIAVTNFLKE